MIKDDDARSFDWEMKPGFTGVIPAKDAWPAIEPHPCGLEAWEFNVIIDQDPVQEKTAGGLILIDQEKQKHQTTRGTIIDMSPLAFTYGDWPDGFRKPAVGGRVAFAQYGGTFLDGEDGAKYRVVKDKDIIARVRA
mgnify:FL=1